MDISPDGNLVPGHGMCIPEDKWDRMVFLARELRIRVTLHKRQQVDEREIALDLVETILGKL